MIIAISLAHGGKTPDVDAGSVSDANGDGSIGLKEREEFLAGIFAVGLTSQLRIHKHQVYVYGNGDYSVRARQMRELSPPPDVVIYPHLDVRPTPNPLVFFTEGSSKGQALAGLIAYEVSNQFPTLGVGRAGPATERSSPGGKRICAIHAKDAAVCIVMETMTTVQAAAWALDGKLDQLVLAGAAAADGVHAWSKTQGK